MFERLIGRCRLLTFSALDALRNAPGGRAAARVVRTWLPGPYAAVIRRYQAFGLLAAAPKRGQADLCFRSPKLDGMGSEEALVAQRLALAQQLAARRH